MLSQQNTDTGVIHKPQIIHLAIVLSVMMGIFPMVRRITRKSKVTRIVMQLSDSDNEKVSVVLKDTAHEFSAGKGHSKLNSLRLSDGK